MHSEILLHLDLYDDITSNA